MKKGPEDLEYRVEHPDTISSSNEYILDDDMRVKILYIASNLSYKQGDLYGKVTLVIKRKSKHESRFREVYSESLDDELLISHGTRQEDQYLEQRREQEIRHEYVDHFALGYNKKHPSSSSNSAYVVPSMFEDTLNELFYSLQHQYERDMLGNVKAAA